MTIHRYAKPIVVPPPGRSESVQVPWPLRPALAATLRSTMRTVLTDLSLLASPPTKLATSPASAWP